MQKFKLGIDIHGVIDHNPAFFTMLTKILKGHEEIEVHVITGGRYVEEAEKLKEWGIEYDEFFSIYDYHHAMGTDTWYDDKGLERMDDEDWDSTKGDYCYREDITIMIDDTAKYGLFMPSTTHFYHYNTTSKRDKFLASYYANMKGI